MKINEAAKILETHNRWRRRGDVEAVDAIQVGMAIDALTGFVKSLRVSGGDPVVGRRYMLEPMSKSTVKFEVKVIGGAQLCACKDFLKNFSLIESSK